MGKERVIKTLLKEVYVRLSIRRGMSRKRVNKLMRDLDYFEGVLRPEVVDRVEGQAMRYLEMEDPGSLGKDFRDR